nr:hypothetical protein [Jiangella sp. DSM 45060]
MLGSITMGGHVLDEADLLDRMERNLAEHACHLHRSMTGATVTEAGDLWIADSGMDDDTFNIVARPASPPPTRRPVSSGPLGRWLAPVVVSPGGWGPPRLQRTSPPA